MVNFNYLKIPLFGLIFLLPFLSYGQMSISGTVSDAESGQTLPGVTVVVKGTSTGTVTDIEGNYTLSVPAGNNALIFSFVGYTTQEVEINNRSVIDLALTPDITSLEEVIVVGYGTQRKSVVTAAISSVREEELQTISNQRVEQALQGRTAGVTVLPTSGSPGSPVAIRIRGAGSNNSSQPLFIVDGMRAGGIEYLDPSEIASIEVLKDAASAAIYGAEGANGVVIITTKTGKRGGAEVNYHGQFGVQSVGDAMPLMNARQYQIYNEEAGTNTRPSASDVTDPVGTNWLDEVFTTAPQQSHSLTFSGGSENSSFLVGGTYFSQEGIVGGDKARFDRITVRVNSDHQIKPWLKVGERLSYSNFKRNAISENDEFGSLLSSALSMDPLTPVVYTDPNNYPPHLQNAIAAGHPLRKDENGNYYGLSRYVLGEYYNPVSRLELFKGGLTQNKIVGNVFADLTPIKGLTITSRFGIDAAFQREAYWTPTFWYNPDALNNESHGSIRHENWYNWQWENFATYQNTIGDHDFSVLIGMSSLENRWDYAEGTYSGIMKEDDLFGHADFTPDIQDKIGSNANKKTLLSYFGRVTYGYKDKYLINATLRRDGSSLLAAGNNWGSFPSISAGWTISNEDFYSGGISNIMNAAKLRASWGRNGSLANLEIGQWRSVITPQYPGYLDAAGNYLIGSSSLLITNPDLKWETSEQIDIGADLAFFNNRLTFTTDYFIKKTKDLLTPGTSFGPAGNELLFINGGTVENRGWEFELSYRSDVSRALQYEVAANLSTLKNEVTYLNPIVGSLLGDDVGTGWTATMFDVGLPIWYFHGYKTDGIFQDQGEVDAYTSTISGYQPAPGDPRVVDVNGDNQITLADQTYIGSPHPDMIFGARINLAYKGFDLLVFAQGQIGNEVLMGFNRTDRQSNNRPEFFFTDRWTPQNRTNEWFRAETESVYVYNSDLMVFDGSYLRIRQLQLGYTLPSTFLESINIRNLRVYASLDNYFTFTKYPGMDPEVGEGRSVGVDRGGYPLPRKAMFGVQLNF